MSVTEDRHAELLKAIEELNSTVNVVRSEVASLHRKIDGIIDIARNIHAEVAPVVETVRTKGIMSLLTMRR